MIADKNTDRGNAVAGEVRSAGGRALAVKTDVANPSSVESLISAVNAATLRLWPRMAQLTLGTKYVAVEARNPLTPARGHIEVADSGLDVRRDVVPIELRILIDQVRRRSIAELPVQTSLFKFVVKRIGLFSDSEGRQVDR